MALATACPRCGSSVPSDTSDFCEHCSAYLYPGHCVFCLQPFLAGQDRCVQCGNPPEGVVCGACGTFSRFDFCPNPDCGAGLTARASEELARVDSDPEIVDAFAELDEIAAVVAAIETVASPPEVTKPSAIESASASEPVVAKAVAPTPSTRPSLAGLRAAAMGAKTAVEKAQVRQLAEQAAQDALHAVSSREFPTAQEARAAGCALQVALRCRVQTERLETISWRCNRFGVEHPEPGGMSLCSDPSGGGVPIMRIITEIDDRSTEFTA
jgi:hypothetical protein